MNGAAAKQSRREIRRAMGPHAIGVLDSQGSHLRTLATDFYSYRDHAEATFAEHASDQSWLRQEHTALAKSLDTFTGRSLRQRLRWLVLGR